MHQTKVKNMYLLPIKRTKEIGKFKYFYVGHKINFCKFCKTENYLNFMVLKLKTRKQNQFTNIKKILSKERTEKSFFYTIYCIAKKTLPLGKRCWGESSLYACDSPWCVL